MSSKILMPQLVSMLAASAGIPKKSAEVFLKAYFGAITEALENHDTVKIKELGTFKVNRVEARKSVDVSTGGETKIPAHYKVAFVPSKQMADKVNKEFAWLDIVEISDNISNSELKNLTSETNQHEEEEMGKNEDLGEEMEKEFGEIEPTEPFGPIDPEDPEPGEPEENHENEHSTSDEQASADDQTLAAPEIYTETAEPTMEAVPAHENTEHREREFDPYKLENQIREEEDAQNRPPKYLLREELEDLASKDDFRILARNIKRLKLQQSESAEDYKERSRKTLLWSLILCIVLVTGGFFLSYWLLYNKLTEWNITATQRLQGEIEEELDDDEYYPVSVSGMDTDEISDSTLTAVKAAVGNSGDTNQTPAATSDIKAIDKVTSSRYLTTMAKEHFGNYNFWPYIYLENEDKLGHPDKIKPGTTVVIPSVEKYGIDPSNPKDIEKAKKLGVEIYKKYAKK